ncbi:MAG: papain-like cysteine protease family protein [Planctomycetota bacterium]
MTGVNRVVCCVALLGGVVFCTGCSATSDFVKKVAAPLMGSGDDPDQKQLVKQSTDETDQAVLASSEIGLPKPANLSVSGSFEERFDDILSHRVSQKKPVWCWAACAEIIHRYHGRTDLDQETLVSDKVGWVKKFMPVSTGSVFEIASALDPDSYQDFERMASSLAVSGSGTDFDFDEKQLINDVLAYMKTVQPGGNKVVASLQQNEPAVLGLKMHAGAQMKHLVVLAGADYEIDDGQLAITTVYYVDPWTDSDAKASKKFESMQVMSWADFETNVDLVMTRVDANRFLAILNSQLVNELESEGINPNTSPTELVTKRAIEGLFK